MARFSFSYLAIFFFLNFKSTLLHYLFDKLICTLLLLTYWYILISDTFITDILLNLELFTLIHRQEKCAVTCWMSHFLLFRHSLQLTVNLYFVILYFQTKVKLAFTCSIHKTHQEIFYKFSIPEKIFWKIISDWY